MCIKNVSRKAIRLPNGSFLCTGKWQREGGEWLCFQVLSVHTVCVWGCFWKEIYIITCIQNKTSRSTGICYCSETNESHSLTFEERLRSMCVCVCWKKMLYVKAIHLYSYNELLKVFERDIHTHPPPITHQRSVTRTKDLLHTPPISSATFTYIYYMKCIMLLPEDTFSLNNMKIIHILSL